MKKLLIILSVFINGFCFSPLAETLNEFAKVDRPTLLSKQGLIYGCGMKSYIWAGQVNAENIHFVELVISTYFDEADKLFAKIDVDVRITRDQYTSPDSDDPILKVSSAWLKGEYLDTRKFKQISTNSENSFSAIGIIKNIDDDLNLAILPEQTLWLGYSVDAGDDKTIRLSDVSNSAKEDYNKCWLELNSKSEAEKKSPN